MHSGDQVFLSYIDGLVQERRNSIANAWSYFFLALIHDMYNWKFILFKGAWASPGMVKKVQNIRGNNDNFSTLYT